MICMIEFSLGPIPWLGEGTVGIDISCTVARHHNFSGTVVRRVDRHNLERCAKKVTNVPQHLYSAKMNVHQRGTGLQVEDE